MVLVTLEIGKNNIGKITHR